MSPFKTLVAYGYSTVCIGAFKSKPAVEIIIISELSSKAWPDSKSSIISVVLLAAYSSRIPMCGSKPSTVPVSLDNART